MNYYLQLNNTDIQSLDKYIKDKCVDNEMDLELFQTELSKRVSKTDPSAVRNPYWFIKAVIDNTIKEHKEDYKLHVLQEPSVMLHGEYQPLFQDLRDKGFTEERYEHYLITLIEDRMLSTEKTAEELNALNHRAIQHCLINNNKTFSEFIAYISKGIDITRLKEKAIKHLEELKML